MKPMSTLFILSCVLLMLSACDTPGEKGAHMPEHFITDATMTTAVDSLIARYGEEHRARIERGVAQVARLWRSDDGSQEEYLEFCREKFIADSDQLDKTFERLQHNFMLISGYFMEMSRDLNYPLQVDIGPILPIDYQFGEFSPSAHATEDLFQVKVAFTVLLNFPITTLKERLEQGAEWSRRQWAETRLAAMFDTRVPPEVRQQLTVAYTNADNYINSYNIVLHNVLNTDGERLFPEGLTLISHWGLRDELKAQYANPDGFPRQQLIYQVMRNIISQDIPQAVIDNPEVDWYIDDNVVVPFGAQPDAEQQQAEREEDIRYTHWLNIFNAQRGVDPFHPDNPSHIDRRFNVNREIPEDEVEALLLSILTAPEIRETAELIRERLGRSLEPFDIWYPGFKSKPDISEEELDRIVSAKYPTVEDFEKDIPNILTRLGFTYDRAEFLASKITVDPSRGAGHAMGSGRLVDNARLRTRVSKGGMNYKGYNIAMHELGHNVEQVMSYQLIDYTFLRSVPNVAFTEGFAFVFQARDLDVLGLQASDDEAARLKTLDVLWSTYEIGGVALVDMRVWRWMYDNPTATPTQLREAVMDIARDVWNSYYAPVLGMEDEFLHAIYSHMIDAGLYTPDYPLGHIIAFQIEQYLEGKNLGQEMERMCTIGNVSPDLWMRTAVDQGISTEPLLQAAREALDALR